MKTNEIQTADIQGIVISGYSHLFFSCYLFLQSKSPCQTKQWLALIAESITTADRRGSANTTGRKPKSAINIAISHSGLKALELPNDSINTFPQEFREGITEPSRSRRLGDNGNSDPVHWDIGGVTADGVLKNPLHILLILQASSESALAELRLQYETQALRHGVSLIHSEEGYRLPDHKEHFGFRDGISQPDVEGSPNGPDDAGSAIKTGEFILGYPNSYGSLPPTPMVAKASDVNKHLQPLPHVDGNSPQDFVDLGQNGTYLVFRKLHQDVAGFRTFFQNRFPNVEEQKLMMAKAVGRWPSGTPLVLSPDRDNTTPEDVLKSDDFGYTTDLHGYGCPIGSHIRRSNPRDSLEKTDKISLEDVNRHRILRRGVSYGKSLPVGQMEDDGKPRGLLFFCINADLKRQFEFLQQTWINNPKFNGLYNDPDPLVGDNIDAGDKPRTCNLTIPRQPVRTRIKELPRFVTVKGGCYFFLPGIATLRYLASLPSVMP
ncbi:MAG TPA: peroxidase [Verrucomicrobiae bacterium]|nr:peroxidase [Verrucomicrobiae bacterium]